MPKTPSPPATLKEYPQGSIITKLNDQFIDEHLALNKERKKKEAEKNRQGIRQEVEKAFRPNSLKQTETPAARP